MEQSPYRSQSSLLWSRTSPPVKNPYLCRVHLSQLSGPNLSETKQTQLPITIYFKLILILSFHPPLRFVIASLLQLLQLKV